MQPPRLPEKKDVALALLEQATVFVHLDPRVEQVSVPAWFKRQPQLVLQIGLNMPIPIPDLEVDAAGLSCTLSFNRAPHHCQIPWSAVFALVGDNGRGMVWPESVPPEVAAEAEKQAKAAQAKAKLAPVPAAAVAAPAVAPAVTVKLASKRKKVAAAAAAPLKRTASQSKASEAKRGVKVVKEPKKARTARKPKAAPVAVAMPAAAPEAARSATAGVPSAAPKRKRELPPYLRIVK